VQHKVVYSIDSCPCKDFRSGVDDMLVEEIEIGREHLGVTTMNSNVVLNRYRSAIS
jgi:hypothetical protein